MFFVYGKLRNGHQKDGLSRMNPFNQLHGHHVPVSYCSLPLVNRFCIVWNLLRGSCLHVSIKSKKLKFLYIFIQFPNFLLSFTLLAKSLSKQALPVADLAQRTLDQTQIGGQPQSICWDPTGKYVAISFKNSSPIAIFATTIAQSNLNISPAFFINGLRADEYPSYICFKETYENEREVILTIGWSSGRVQYFPFIS